MAKAYIDPFSEGIALVFRSSGDILRSGQYPKGFVQFELQQIGVRGGGGGQKGGGDKAHQMPRNPVPVLPHAGRQWAGRSLARPLGNTYRV